MTNELEEQQPVDESEKLRKAVELTISSGYQLSQDAFGLLSTLAAAEDPAEIIKKAVKKIADLNERRLFIDRAFLECLLAKSEIAEEQTVEQVLNPAQEGQVQGSPEPTAVIESFYPYAKEVDSDIKVIEDPGSKLNSDGTMEDFLEYFRDRFRRIEKMLRQRIDVKGASSIKEALKASPNAKLKIIGMITEKRESKKRVILSLEDLEAGITALVPQNAPEDLWKKTNLLLLDQIICLSVTKTRSNLVIVDDITLPEIGQRTQHKAPIPVYAALTSDLHIGSTKFQKEAFNRFILWLNGKYGDKQMKEVASHVKYVLIAGDIVDGVGVYPRQAKELVIRDVYKQYRLAARFIEQIPDYIEVVVIPGNHDAPRKALPQPPISRNYLQALEESRKVHSLGDPCYLSLHGVEVLMYHGRSLDDVISAVPDVNHNNPEKAMRLLLQSRHLAPLYGGKTTLSPERKDSLVIEHIPDIFQAGHIHSLGHCNYRGVLVVNSGGWQTQTDYMQRLGFSPTPGKVPVVNLQTLNLNVISFM